MRSVVASCGTLYVTVTSVKRGKRHTFVGTDSGFNHLIRPTLYEAHHEIWPIDEALVRKEPALQDVAGSRPAYRSRHQ